MNSLFNSLVQSTSNNLISNIENNLRIANPNAYSQLQTILKSGNTDEAISNMVRQLNPAQTAQFKNTAGMLGINVDKYLR